MRLKGVLRIVRNHLRVMLYIQDAGFAANKGGWGHRIAPRLSGAMHLSA